MGLLNRLRDLMGGPSKAPDNAGPALADTPDRARRTRTQNKPTAEHPRTEADLPDRRTGPGKHPTE